MDEDDLESQRISQNQRKLAEHLEKIRKFKGVPPKEQARQQEETAFRADWEAWKQRFGQRIVHGRPPEENSRQVDCALLGVSTKAGAEEIRRAFYRLAKANHPDHGGSEEKFRALMAAYHRLTQA